MKITIIGGSRGTGAQLATLAQAAGHDVTVLSRSGDAPDGVRVVAGDATKAAVARQAVDGADAVVITVGGAKGVPRQRTKVTRSVVAAMQELGVPRVLMLSSLGAGGSGNLLPAPLRLITRVVLATALADHDEQESVVMGSGLSWTVVRPAGLTNRPPTGSWRVAETPGDEALGGSISRGDLAAYLLELLSDDATIGRALGVSGR